jgi:3-oxoacyl-[acyl-carrier protein] reductase
MSHVSASAKMENPMNTRVLQEKTAVVFGAGGSIGAAVAKEFAAEGALVFLAGPTRTSLEAVAKQIIASGGQARTAVIDALDDAGVNQYVDGIVKQVGRVDIVLDAAGLLAKWYGNGRQPRLASRRMTQKK